jgi:hypothetical protein
MIYDPTAPELIDAVVGFIERHAAPNLKDRDVFLARVAVNALNAVKREIEQSSDAQANAALRLESILGKPGSLDDLNRELCDNIRNGVMDKSTPGLMAHLRASIIDQVRIDQPNYAGLKTLEATAKP